MKLTIELVPKSCFFSNVRSEVSKSDWDIIRKIVYKKANYICEICGSKGPNHPVECHEVWDYNEKKKIQKLERMIALCPACHEVKHLGLAELRGRGPAAVSHLAKVNNLKLSEAKDYIVKEFDTWQRRSKIEWKLDVSHLAEYGINIKALNAKRKS